MQNFSTEGRRVIEDVARRHGVSTDAVATLLLAVAAGHGAQAQFNHPDLGGMGQWSQGGMLMIGDMFNNGLKARVDALCNELAGLVRNDPQLAAMPAQWQSQSRGGADYQSQGGGYQAQGGGNFQSQGGSYANQGGASLFVPSAAATWWPADLGVPSSAGAQNSMRYAVFPQARRLAIDLGGNVTVYDTGDHMIGGFSQQQSGDQSLTFTSQYGTLRIADLAVVFPAAAAAVGAPSTPPAAAPAAATVAPSAPQPASAPVSADDIFAKIERLADLMAKGILTAEEFAAKKAELLGRL